MNEQHEQAAKALELGKQALDAGIFDKAVRLFEKSLRMRKTAEAEALLACAQKSVDRQEAKKNASSTTPSSTPPPTDTRAFTKEQEEGCRRILLSKTHYEVLNLEKSCEQSEIKKSYRRLSLKFHPDKCSAPKAEEAFKRLNSAFEILSNEDDRAHYDRYGESSGPNSHQHRGQNHHHHAQHMDVDEIFRMFFQGHNQMRGGGFQFPQQQQQRRQHHAHAHAPNEGINLHQVLFGLFAFFFLFSGFGSPSAPAAAVSTQSSVFSLFPNQQFSVKRTTAMHGVVKDIPYFVDKNFASTIGKSPRNLYYVETSVESSLYAMLKEKCLADKRNREINSEACVRQTELERRKLEHQ